MKSYVFGAVLLATVFHIVFARSSYRIKRDGQGNSNQLGQPQQQVINQTSQGQTGQQNSSSNKVEIFESPESRGFSHQLTQSLKAILKEFVVKGVDIPTTEKEVTKILEGTVPDTSFDVIFIIDGSVFIFPPNTASYYARFDVQMEQVHWLVFIVGTPKSAIERTTLDQKDSANPEIHINPGGLGFSEHDANMIKQKILVDRIDGYTLVDLLNHLYAPNIFKIGVLDKEASQTQLNDPGSQISTISHGPPEGATYFLVFNVIYPGGLQRIIRIIGTKPAPGSDDQQSVQQEKRSLASRAIMDMESQTIVENQSAARRLTPMLYLEARGFTVEQQKDIIAKVKQQLQDKANLQDIEDNIINDLSQKFQQTQFDVSLFRNDVGGLEAPTEVPLVLLFSVSSGLDVWWCFIVGAKDDGLEPESRRRKRRSAVSRTNAGQVSTNTLEEKGWRDGEVARVVERTGYLATLYFNEKFVRFTVEKYLAEEFPDKKLTVAVSVNIDDMKKARIQSNQTILLLLQLTSQGPNTLFVFITGENVAVAASVPVQDDFSQSGSQLSSTSDAQKQMIVEIGKLNDLVQVSGKTGQLHVPIVSVGGAMRCGLYVGALSVKGFTPDQLGKIQKELLSILKRSRDPVFVQTGLVAFLKTEFSGLISKVQVAPNLVYMSEVPPNAKFLALFETYNYAKPPLAVLVLASEQESDFAETKKISLATLVGDVLPKMPSMFGRMDQQAKQKDQL